MQSVDFCHFAKGENSCDFLFASVYTKPLLKRVSSIREDFVPFGSKLFPYRADPFSEGDKKKFDRVVSKESVSLPPKSGPSCSKLMMSSVNVFLQL